jgi:hypothetical protein
MVTASRESESGSIDDRPSCFGFAVTSTCDFKFLRSGGGADTLEIVEAADPLSAPDSTLLLEWTVRDPTADITARLYNADGIYHFWTNDAGWYRVDPAARRIEISDHKDEIRREQRLWGVPTALCAKQRGDFVLHGAAIEVDGGAILLAAPGRFGKSTLALAFHRQGYRILTEDTACCALRPGPVLYPGPTSIRLRPDMFDGQAPAGTTVIDVRPDRIHLLLDSERTGGGGPVPIKMVVFLRESPDEIRLERVKSGQALPDLWTLGLRFQNEAERRRTFTQLASLAANIPVYNLHRPLTIADLDAVVSRLIEASR